MGEPQLIQVHRRASTPTLIQSGMQQTTMPILSGMPSHQKLIVVSGPGGTSSPITLTTTQHQHQQSQGGPGHANSVVPLLRPVQPGSPLIVHSANQLRPGGLQPQHHLVVSSGGGSSNLGQRLGMSSIGLGQSSHCHPNKHHHNTNTFTHNTVQHHSTPVTTSGTTTIITPQQLAMLLQQQPQHPQPHQQNGQTQQQPQRPQTVPLPFINVSHSNVSRGRPNSASSIHLSTNSNSPGPHTNPNSTNKNCPSPVFITSSQLRTSNSPQPQTHQIKIVNPQFLQSHTNPRLPFGQHQVLQIPIQRQQQHPAGGVNPRQETFPLRAQIVTSNGETLTIHRASGGSLNSQIRLTGQMRPFRPGILPQNVVISTSRVSGSPGPQIQGPGSSSPGLSNPSNPNLNHGLNEQGIRRTQAGTVGSPVRIISRSNLHDNFLQTFVTNATNSAHNSNNSNSTPPPNPNNAGPSMSPVSNLAEFITSQLAASNIRPISPLAYENGGGRVSGTLPGSPASSIERNSNSPSIFIQHHQQTHHQGQSDQQHRHETDSSQSTSSSSNIMLVSLISNETMKQEESSQQEFSQSGMGELIPCDTIMDLQDAISVIDSPYSLISETDPQNISEMIDIPSSMGSAPPSSPAVVSTSMNPGTSSTQLFHSTSSAWSSSLSSSSSSRSSLSNNSIPNPTNSNLLRYSNGQSCTTNTAGRVTEGTNSNNTLTSLPLPALNHTTTQSQSVCNSSVNNSRLDVERHTLLLQVRPNSS